MSELTDRAATRDEAAFRELFDAHHARVFRYAYTRLGSATEAQDATQDVFLEAWKGLPRFKNEHEGSFPAWLFGIARHVVASALRKRGRHPATVPLDEGDGTTAFEERVVSGELLRRELAKLPEMQREAVILRIVMGIPAREVATLLGKTEGAVAALQVRGLESLKKRIGHEI